MPWFTSLWRAWSGVANAAGGTAPIGITPSKWPRPGKMLMAGLLGLPLLGVLMHLSIPTDTEGTGRIDATLRCPIPGKNPESVSKAVSYHVGPSPCDYATLGKICRTLVMTEITCTWEGFELGGEPVTKSLWHGQGYWEGDNSKAVVTSGYDWGTTTHGDNYLSRWTEVITAESIAANWTLVHGTGGLQGVTGNATIVCPPTKPTDTMEVCKVSGTYELPQ